jgi:hypothetical protein
MTHLQGDLKWKLVAYVTRACLDLRRSLPWMERHCQVVGVEYTAAHTARVTFMLWSRAIAPMNGAGNSAIVTISGSALFQRYKHWGLWLPLLSSRGKALRASRP